MYAIEITQRNGEHSNRYIAGIFSDVAKHDQVSDAIPIELQGGKKLVQTKCSSYPLFVVEQASGFHYGDRQALSVFFDRVKAALANADAATLNDEPLFTLYRIEQDFEPGTVGNDEMGLLSHRHVTRHDLDAEHLPGLMESLLY
jgi:hypothetical protein